jgi:hypothetical protein
MRTPLIEPFTRCSGPKRIPLGIRLCGGLSGIDVREGSRDARGERECVPDDTAEDLWWEDRQVRRRWGCNACT